MSYVGAESAVSDQWLDATLKASTALIALVGQRIYPDFAPHDQTGNQIEYPFVVYQVQTSTDTYGVGPHSRIFATADYIVRAVAESTYAALAPVVNAIDTAIEGQRSDLSDGTVLSCQRLSEYRMPEQLEGRIVRHLGGVYRVLVQAK